jgi:hypothetical protein
MDWFDRHIIQYMLRWAPFGGPPDDDVLPRFGMTPVQLRRRFARVVAKMATQPDRLSVEEAALLAAVRGVDERQAADVAAAPRGVVSSVTTECI